MDRKSLRASAIVLFAAVALGAFGAHGLKSLVTTDALANWQTGVAYQFYHGLALMGLSALAPHLKPGAVRWASRAFLLGILLFSGSLYLLVLREMLGIHGLVMVLGPLTPLGGLAFLVGWSVLAFSALGQD